MKKSRIGIRRRQRKVSIGIAIFFLVILPVTAVVIGSRITEWLVVPTINTDYILNFQDNIALENTEESENNIVKEDVNSRAEDIEEKIFNTETIDLNSISAYMIQIASISDTKHIEALIEDLNNHNFPNIVYKIDNVYKVYAFGSTNREDVEAQLDRVREIYADAYIGQIHVPQKQIYYSKEENMGTDEVVDNINLLIELLRQSSDSLYKFMNTEVDIEEYGEVLNQHQKLLDQISAKVKNVELPGEFANADDINKMIDYQEKNISDSLKILEENPQIHRLQNYFLDTLFRTIEVIKK